jgi:tetratricopeptide (TPR) repeat protein
MHRPWIFLLTLSISAALPLAARADAHQQLHDAADLASRGHYKEAIAMAEPVINSVALSDTERGRGWTLLGLAFEYEGEFQNAESAYENALRILETRKDDAEDYAAALRDFGTLYRDMRQYDAASQLELRALRGDQQINDHGGVAIACVNLAGIELDRRHIRKARAWLDEAVRESKAAPALDQSFYAFLISSQSSLADVSGDTRAAIAGHQKEIEYLTQTQGEENPTLGWAYMLLGKAYLDDHNTGDALINMRKGLAILGKTESPNNPHFLMAQIAYARALNSTGTRAEAGQIEASAEEKLRAYYQEQCARCRITALALH